MAARDRIPVEVRSTVLHKIPELHETNWPFIELFQPQTVPEIEDDNVDDVKCQAPDARMGGAGPLASFEQLLLTPLDLV